MKVSELEPPLLDFWVAKAENLKIVRHEGPIVYGWFICETPTTRLWTPSTDWSQGGPIAQNHWTKITQWLQMHVAKDGRMPGYDWPFWFPPDELLLWLMRAYVASKFGEEVGE